MRRFLTALAAVVTLGAAAAFAPTAAANTSYSVAIGTPGFAFGYSNGGYANGGYVAYGPPYYYAPAPYYGPYYYGPSVAYYGYYGPHYYHHRYYRHY
jgi:hypothetical protein